MPPVALLLSTKVQKTDVGLQTTTYHGHREPSPLETGNSIFYADFAVPQIPRFRYHAIKTRRVRSGLERAERRLGVRTPIRGQARVLAGGIAVV